MLHGSDSPETAEKELSKFFAVEQTLAVIKPDAMSEKGATVKQLEVDFYDWNWFSNSKVMRDVALWSGTSCV